jgi:hypothetical protein
MTERQWELYRRSVVERQPDSEYKTSVLSSINRKLAILDHMESFSPHRRRRSDTASIQKVPLEA